MLHNRTTHLHLSFSQLQQAYLQPASLETMIYKMLYSNII